MENLKSELKFAAPMYPIFPKDKTQEASSDSAKIRVLRHGVTSVASSFWRMFAVYVLSDIVSLLCAFSLGIVLRRAISLEGFSYEPYINLMPLILVFLGVYWYAKIYPIVALNSVDELRRLSLSTCGVFSMLAATTFMMRGMEVYSRLAFVTAWILALVFVPFGRALARMIFSKCAWWGIPTVVLGAGVTGRRVIRELRIRRELGLRPVAVLDDDPEKQLAPSEVPVLGPLSMAPSLAKEMGIHYAILAMPSVQCDRMISIVELHAKTFRHILVVPELFGFSVMRMASRDIGGVLALDVCQQLLLPGRQMFKRAIDLSTALIGGLLIMPFLLLIAILLKLDSPGPVLFRQKRLGQDGELFGALKFRTMVVGAEDALQHLLRDNPELKKEYDTYHKLRDDPRVTRIGRLLRRASLDELPQLWNVFVGEMSLVGPRAYMPSEIPKMQQREDVILRVKPGITGLWQVSGRNKTTFEERLNFDVAYIRNWSPWMDLYILAKTVPVVLCLENAY